MVVHLVGNSHLHTFSGVSGRIEYTTPKSELLRFYHLGPTTAFRFYDKHLPIIKKDYLGCIDKNNDYISFIAGDVDIRCKIPKYADLLKQTDEQNVKECFDSFERVYDELDGYKHIIWATHPTTNEEHSMDNEQRPIYGNMERRNNICLLWNKRLKEIADSRGYPFLSFYDDLVDENNRTKMEYFMDYCHLKSEMVYPFIQREFKKIDIVI